MTRLILSRLVFISVLGLLAGCESRDPYERTDVWQPTGANMANIAAMAANPGDLVAGRHSDRQDTRATGIAIDHVWSGQLTPLVQSAAGGATPAPSAAPPAAGGSPGGP